MPLSPVTHLKLSQFALFLCVLVGGFTTYAHVKTDIHVTQKEKNIHELSVLLEPITPDLLPHDLITLSLDHSDLEINQWVTNQETQEYYDLTFKDTRKVYKTPLTFSITAHSKGQEPIHNAHLYVTYYSTNMKKMINVIVPVDLEEAPQDKLVSGTEPELLTAIDMQQDLVMTSTHKDLGTHKKNPVQAQAPKSYSEILSGWVTTTQSLWLKLLLVLILGLLMSLTPCIYPMIPITVGIIQANASKTLFSNFLLSLSYTMGIATTFAVLGLLAASSGQLFGALLTSPFFVLIMVALLCYLALSMFGLYDMYTPKFLRGNNNKAKGGSFLSVFVFGAVSGTVASPCVSPGLILLLSIVTQLGSKLLGFLFLFLFGFGLGVPLLIIGTFSGALNVLPRAGMWMVEVKKLFGFMLFGMCFYFLNNILPYTLLLALITVFCLIAGIFYLQSINKYDSVLWKKIKNGIGFTLIIASVVFGALAIKESFMQQEKTEEFWLTDYTIAHTQALEQNKKLFVDVGAPYCSICKAIDRTLLSHERVISALHKGVAVKIDISDPNNPAVAELQKKYNIIGAPAYLIINPVDGGVVEQWAGELYDKSPEDFAQELIALL